jgi:hypothetical protein
VVVALSRVSFRACGPRNFIKWLRAKIEAAWSGEIVAALENVEACNEPRDSG